MIDKNEVLRCCDVGAWDAWLAKHHGKSDGIWLLIAKKGSGEAAISIVEALDTALCYGWIDSQRKAYDAGHYLQRYSPRRAKSPWSKLNVERVDALVAAKRMRAAGLTEVEKAKHDGRWKAAYVSQRNVDLPLDFVAALNAAPSTKAAFAQLTKTARYALLLPVLKAATPTVRVARLKKAVGSLVARQSSGRPVAKSKRS